MSGPAPTARISPRIAHWLDRLDALEDGERAMVADESVPYRDLLPDNLREAAVLVPIRPGDDGDEVVLTRRRDDLRHHAGQVSFPGGRVEPHDDTRLVAAVRETEEEIGLAREQVRPIGCLSPVLTLTGFAMMPFVAEIEPTAEFVACPREVAEIFTVPLAFFLDANNFETRRRFHEGKMREFQVLQFEEHFIWGATAAVLFDLFNRVATLEASP